MNKMGLVAVVLAAAIGAAGCGGDDDGDGSSLESSELSKGEWIAEADRICAEGDREIDRQAGELFGDEPPSEAQIADFSREVVVPGVQSQIDGIRALGAPEGDEDEVRAFLEAGEDAVAGIEQSPTSIQTGEPFAEVERLAGEYGLQVCATGEED